MDSKRRQLVQTVVISSAGLVGAVISPLFNRKEPIASAAGSLVGIDGAGSGITPPAAYGVWGDSASHYGVIGTTKSGNCGIYGRSDLSATGNVDTGFKAGGIGVFGINNKPGGIGVYGQAKGGVFGGTANYGVYGDASASNGIGVYGSSTSSYGVYGSSTSSYGVIGITNSGNGVAGYSNNVGVYAHNNTVSGHDAYLASNCCAGDFHGPVSILGQLTKSSGSFKIDHPLDPANKYLSHSFVESPDMMNIYNGVVVLDAKGESVVELPSWFNALNKDFRYQLTPIGAPAPNLYIVQEIQGNNFKIAGGKVGLKVSWQVTGIRQDAWADAYRIPVEEAKSAQERGYYLHPQLFGETKEKSMRLVHYPDPETTKLTA